MKIDEQWEYRMLDPLRDKSEGMHRSEGGDTCKANVSSVNITLHIDNVRIGIIADYEV